MSKIHFLTVCFSLLASLASAQQAFTLQEAITYAQQNSVQARKAQLSIEDALAQIKETQAIGIPKISGKVDYQYYLRRPTMFFPDFIGPSIVGVLEAYQLVPPGSAAGVNSGGLMPVQFGMNHSLAASITASTLVFDGAYLVGLKAAKEMKNLYIRQADLTAQEIKYTIIQAYLTILIAEENYQMLLKNLNNLKSLRDETAKFNEQGLVEELDVDRLDLNLQNLQTEADIVARQVELAYNLLKFQMNYDLLADITLSDNLQGLLMEAAQEDLEGNIDISKRIEVDVLKQNETLTAMNIRRIKMGYAPNLSAFINYQQQLQRNNLFDSNQPGFISSSIIGATLNVPIFDGFDKKHKVERATIAQKNIALEMESLKRSIELQVINSRAQYVNAKARLEAQERNLNLANRILERTKTKYKSGVGSSIEVTTTEQELYRTQTNYLNALYDFVVSKNNLDKALGK